MQVTEESIYKTKIQYNKYILNYGPSLFFTIHSKVSLLLNQQHDRKVECLKDPV